MNLIQRQPSDVTVGDWFCGAGGSSVGVVRAGGRLVVAVNHSPRAIETHQTNHPYAQHYITDLQKDNPSRFPRTNILWASPECTNHSSAKGKKTKNLGQMEMFGDSDKDAAAERSRATMFEVVRATETHKYEIVIVENVIDVRRWEHFDSWLSAMIRLGYNHQILYWNARFFRVPQSRDRFYAVFWKKGNKKPDLEFRPDATCPHCGPIGAVQSWKDPNKPEWGRYGKYGQYVYRCPNCKTEVLPPHVPAWTVIDWSNLGQRIGDRKKTLEAATIRRIKEGIRRFSRVVNNATELDPYIVSYYSRTNASSEVTDPIPTIPTENRHSLIVPPLLTSVNYFDDIVRPVDDILASQTTSSKMAITVPPFLLAMKNSARDGYTMPPRSMDDVLSTLVTTSQHALIAPFIAEMHGTSTARSVIDPLMAICAKGEHHALISPPVWTDQALDDIVQNCGFRMLDPKELADGMSFPDDYIITGNKGEQVEQIGNAVCPNVAEEIVRRCVESLL